MADIVLMTPGETETDIAGGDYAHYRETPPGDRINSPDDDDIDYEDENRIEPVE